MNSIPFYIVFAMFTLKIIWNVLIPFEFWRRHLMNDPDQSGISLCPFEIFLIPVILTISAHSEDTVWFHGTGKVAALVITMLVGSYVWLCLPMALADIWKKLPKRK